MTAPSCVRLLLAMSLVGTLAPGCGGNKTPASEDSTAVKKLVELRAERRRDRMRMRQLEEKMARIARESHELSAPELPIERVAPDAPAEPAIKVVGIADDGSEIVYVGEAAQPVSVSAEAEMRREQRSTPRPPRARRRLPPAPRVSSSGDLGITHKRLPKVTDITRSRPRPKARELPSTRVRRRPRPTAAPPSEVGDYQANVALLRAGNHTEAVRGFRKFLKRFGRSDYADNAQYWLGEAFYDRKKYRQALTEFRLVKRKYPTGNKVPDAQLKAAYCMAALGDKAGARELLAEIASEFPDSRPAELAREKLERLAD